jgi:hypothetical protein
MSAEGSPPKTTFWSTVTWPRREGALVLIAGPALFFVLGLFYAGAGYGALCAAGTLPVLAALWALHRVAKAWAEWPARRRWVSWLKAAVRYLLTDP